MLSSQAVTREWQGCPTLRAVLVALCVTEIISWGLLYYTFPVVAPLISADTTWSSGALTASFSGALAVSALVGVPVGRAIDRHGPRWIMTVGSVAAALSMAVVAVAPNLPVFVFGWLLAGVSMAGVLYAPAFAAITGWFSAGRLRALTALTLVAGLASTVFAPLTALISEEQGWRATYLWAALVLASVTVPIHFFLLRRPWPSKMRTGAKQNADDKAYGATIIRSAKFWLLAAGLTMTSLAASTALLGMVPLMLERGMSMQEAAWMLGLGGVGQVAGRLVYTSFAQPLSLTVRTILVFGAVAVTILALAVVPGPIWLLFVISFVAGLGRGIMTLLKATAITDRWGVRSYGHLSAILSLPVLVVAALAPWIGAMLAMSVGEHARAYQFLALIAAGGAVLAGVSARASNRSQDKKTALPASPMREGRNAV